MAISILDIKLIDLSSRFNECVQLIRRHNECILVCLYIEPSVLDAFKPQQCWSDQAGLNFHIRLQFHRQHLPHSMKPPPLNNHFIIPLPPLDADESLPEPPEPVSIPENPAVQPSGSLLFHSFGDTQPKAIGTISESYCVYEICFSCPVTFCHTSSTSKRIRHFRSLSKW